MALLLYSSCCRQQSYVSPSTDLHVQQKIRPLLSDLCSRTAFRLPLPRTWQYEAFKDAFSELDSCMQCQADTQTPATAALLDRALEGNNCRSGAGPCMASVQAARGAHDETSGPARLRSQSMIGTG